MASVTPSLQVFFCLAAALLVVVVVLHKVLSVLLLRPLRIQRALRDQGIRGPPYRVLVGNFREQSALKMAAQGSPMHTNDHHILPRVLSFYPAWSAQYGSPFLYWIGYQPYLTLPNPEHCKEVLSNKFGHYPKPEAQPDLQDLLGNGLVNLEGEKWAQHRRIVSPAFFLEKLKAMTPTIANLASNMLDTWQSQLQEAGDNKEINAHEEFKALTADIIAHTAFGSSYAEGKQVFELQYEQQKLSAKLAGSLYIPGRRFFSTLIAKGLYPRQPIDTDGD